MSTSLCTLCYIMFVYQSQCLFVRMFWCACVCVCVCGAGVCLNEILSPVITPPPPLHTQSVSLSPLTLSHTHNTKTRAASPILSFLSHLPIYYPRLPIPVALLMTLILSICVTNVSQWSNLAKKTDRRLVKRCLLRTFNRWVQSFVKDFALVVNAKLAIHRSRKLNSKP